MSSGKISEDRKSISFEVNLNGMVGHFMLNLIDGDSVNTDRVAIKFNTNTTGSGTSVNNTNTIIIDKRYSQVLQHWFSHASELMDEWFAEEDIKK